jgi:hypothetical protein
MWLGVRCWKDKLALVVVRDGSPPMVAFARRQAAPDLEDPGERAAWFARAVTEAIEETDCAGVSVRVADADADQERAEAEGAVLAAAHLAGRPTRRFRRQSLLKPLRVGREAGAWKAFQKSDPFVGGRVADEKDAAMASLAGSRSDSAPGLHLYRTARHPRELRCRVPRQKRPQRTGSRDQAHRRSNDP